MLGSANTWKEVQAGSAKSLEVHQSIDQRFPWSFGGSGHRSHAGALQPAILDSNSGGAQKAVSGNPTRKQLVESLDEQTGWLKPWHVKLSSLDPVHFFAEGSSLQQRSLSVDFRQSESLETKSHFPMGKTQSMRLQTPHPPGP